MDQEKLDFIKPYLVKDQDEVLSLGFDFGDGSRRFFDLDKK